MDWGNCDPAGLRATERLASVRPDSGFDCTVDGDLWRLQIWGLLPPAWCANLALHCTAAGFSIIEGDGRRIATTRWVADFALHPTRPEHQPTAFDFLQMARHRPLWCSSVPAPTCTDLSLTHTRDDRLIAYVCGRDEVGFLAWLLREFGDAGLQPQRFCLRTRDTTVEDWFELEGPGGAPISASQVDALRRALAARAQRSV